jgi:DNA replication protein DnaC
MINLVRDAAMSNLAYERLHHNLKAMKLLTVDSILDNYLEVAARDSLSTIEILDYLMDQEIKSRNAQDLSFRTRMAGFPVKRTFEEFQFSFQPSLDQSVVNDLKTLRFIKNAENVVFLGPPGVGKTHLSIALGMMALGAGFRVRFFNASDLIERLVKANRLDRLEEKIKGLARFQLLIVDEIGYLPFNTEGAHAFFQLISSRYETRSIVFTSNKSYSEWGEIFNDQVIASAVLDRILHHCTTINIKGESYRLKERRRQGIPPHKC